MICAIPLQPIRRRESREAICAVLVIVLLAGASAWWWVRGSLPPLDGQLALPGLHDPRPGLFDAYGVPSIYATDSDDAWFAAGAMHARDRLWQMECTGASRWDGCRKCWGADYSHRSTFPDAGLRAAAEAEWPRATPAVKSALESYAAGVNAVTPARPGDSARPRCNCWALCRRRGRLWTRWLWDGSSHGGSRRITRPNSCAARWRRSLGRRPRSSSPDDTRPTRRRFLAARRGRPAPRGDETPSQGAAQPRLPQGGDSRRVPPALSLAGRPRMAGAGRQARQQQQLGRRRPKDQERPGPSRQRSRTCRSSSRRCGTRCTWLPRALM